MTEWLSPSKNKLAVLGPLWEGDIGHWPSGGTINTMTDHDSPLEIQPTQATQPQGTDDEGNPHAPIVIPVPKKNDVMRVLKKSSEPITEKDSD